MTITKTTTVPKSTRDSSSNNSNRGFPVAYNEHQQQQQKQQRDKSFDPEGSLSTTTSSRSRSNSNETNCPIPEGSMSTETSRSKGFFIPPLIHTSNKKIYSEKQIELRTNNFFPIPKKKAIPLAMTREQKTCRI